MLDFEWVAAYLNINRDTIRCLGNTAARIFAFLFQDAWDRKPGHTFSWRFTTGSPVEVKREVPVGAHYRQDIPPTIA